MRATRFLSTVPVSPDEVLAALRDDYRQRAAVDPEVDPGAELTMETPIADWLAICDLRPIDEQRDWLTDWFGVRIDRGAWHGALTPPRRRTLRDLCTLLAAGARRPVVRPFAIAGAPCASAGAFLTLRTWLHERGVLSAGAAPSTPLAPLARRHWLEIHRAAALLAPGALPLVTIRQSRTWRAAALGFATGVGLLLAGAVLHRTGLGALGAPAAAAGYIGMWIAARLGLAFVRFGELATLGDLARVLTRDRDQVT